jgi:hypothetical protein
MLKRLWMDEAGAVLTTELILLLVIVVIGMSVGLTILRDSVVAQMGDLSGAIAAINPAYTWAGILYDPAGTLGAVDLEATGDGATYAFTAPSGWSGGYTDFGAAISGDALFGAQDVLGGIYATGAKSDFEIDAFP